MIYFMLLFSFCILVSYKRQKRMNKSRLSLMKWIGITNLIWATGIALAVCYAAVGLFVYPQIFIRLPDAAIAMVFGTAYAFGFWNVGIEMLRIFSKWKKLMRVLE